MDTNDAIRKRWQSIPPSTRSMLVPSVGTPEPDALDLSRRYEVFSGSNYQVSAEFKDFITKAGLGISRKVATEAVLAAIQGFSGSALIPQRAFVLSLMAQLTKSLPAQAIASLEEMSVQHAYPKAAGLVALAIGIKEAAKTAILSIRSGEIVPVIPAGDLRDDIDTQWLALR
jgi:hypothetical protein